MIKKEQYISKKAVALHYQPDHQDAPVVIAKGRGMTAENIIAKAQENQIPIQEDKSLVQVLSQLNINQAIPEELYGAVAEVFAFIYRLDKKAGSNAD
ncbi:EscU/YscU/HrcU family type III secretion system export apparatus switch protein [Heyndrickxia acidicola]|uniref:EscU/YscU/HrcU family type III secretion system export apparatus switch protein n=1 Tax=Heyndrickxia acidicola TaxID=209389 RepID=A0ABU6MCD0_9BACI|nr:EscU/YscU/HrcU family type III secretion system export apparatus switch protein [Heyndrickxia acidicola]MED1202089.1 EscU/YscU/HrcU family type III secretion system export apparatus switch protein [Heyndrickxia acidicola]